MTKTCVRKSAFFVPFSSTLRSSLAGSGPPPPQLQALPGPGAGCSEAPPGGPEGTRDGAAGAAAPGRCPPVVGDRPSRARSPPSPSPPLSAPAAPQEGSLPPSRLRAGAAALRGRGEGRRAGERAAPPRRSHRRWAGGLKNRLLLLLLLLLGQAGTNEAVPGWRDP